MDNAIENRQCLIGIARIRSYYRTLTPEAAVYFAAREGRWPETLSAPAAVPGSYTNITADY